MYDSPMRSTRDAAAVGGGESGIGARAEVRLDVDVVVVVVPPRDTVVDAGMFAMIVERIVPGVTPRVADVQPATDTEDRTAIAPSRGSERGIMPGTKAALAPVVHNCGTDCRTTA
jgi:hypothetical protein